MLATVIIAAIVYLGQLKEMRTANDLAQEALNKAIRDGAQSAKDTQAALRISSSQLDAQKRQVSAMERGLDTTERAWVLPSLAGPKLTPEGDAVLWDVQVLLRNTGKTPAFVEFAADSSLEPKPPKVHGYESGIVIAPGEA